jgi:hypothetical protein
MQSVIMVALLQIPIENGNIPQKQSDEQRHTSRKVLNEVLRWLIQFDTFTQYLGAKSGYYNVRCADGNCRHCNSVLAAWLAELP